MIRNDHIHVSHLPGNISVGGGRSRTMTTNSILKLLLWVLICICVHICMSMQAHTTGIFIAHKRVCHVYRNVIILLVCIYLQSRLVIHITEENFNKKLTSEMEFTYTSSVRYALQEICKPSL